MKKISSSSRFTTLQRLLLCISAIVCADLLNGCAVSPPAIVSAPVSELEVAPQLTRFTRFELASPASGSGTEQKATGSLVFNSGAASFDVITTDNKAKDRFFIQPETCRDDPSPDCKRRFAVTGRLSALNTTLNCYIPVRNDTSSGYVGQSLSGICQDRYGRSFTITIFSN